ncbi:MAG: serine/threonine protein kinase [Planctomycetota bacterium]|jgi:serine/threonine protein kinase
MTSRQLDEEEIFHIARKLGDQSDRAKYLDQVCAGDVGLRGRVEALLVVHEQEKDFLKSGPVEPASTADHSTLSEGPGTTIGRYRLMEQIGEGGMGVVFVAEQRKPLRRKVALKVIKPGMDTKAVIARFEAERQALALMDHPNIARVFDAGTTESGRPYFVMERVKGAPITEYCDKNRLTIRERLGLFIHVCQAIQHAHQKGIIHRDIKPTNVLVTLHDGEPIPKVIDFGVAKALNARLTDKTIYTEHLQIVGTLLYMSPEQAELSGLDIDTRSDVYSLGVLLYELLTGTTPFPKAALDEAAFDEQRRIIREVDPPRASNRISSLGETATAVAEHRQTDPKKLHQLVHGDLDWIVLKSLEKDRTRRYETASAFAKDVERHLTYEPVVARPPSLVYQLQKFSRRNKAGLITAALVAASLVIGTGMAIWQAYLARQEAHQTDIARQKAQDEANRANSILRSLNQSLFHQGLTYVFSGKEDSAATIVTQLRKQGDQDLADRLEALVLVFGPGDVDKALDLLSTASRRRPHDPGLFATLMFAYNANADFEAYFGSQRKLEELLREQPPHSAADLIFVGSAYTLDSRLGLKYAAQAFKQSPSPVPLLYVARLRADHAMHTGDVTEARRAIKEIEAARFFLGNTIAVRIDGLGTYLVAANAMRSSGHDDEWSHALSKAEAVVADFPHNRELLTWERFYLAEYYYERKQESKAITMLEGAPKGGWGDYDRYFFLALAHEFGAVHEGLAGGNRIGPFTEGGMAMLAGIRGRKDEAESVARRLLDDHDIPDIVLVALDALILAGMPIQDIETLTSEKIGALDSKELDSWSRTTVERIVRIYEGENDEKEALDWAADASGYPNLWLTYTHWALAMRSLAKNDYPGAKEHLEKVVAQRIVTLGQYLWARSLLANWEGFIASRGA